MLATDKKKSKKEKIKQEEKGKQVKEEPQEEPQEEPKEDVKGKTINFCTVCNTVYYPKIEGDELMSICRNCGNKDVADNHIVHRNEYKGDNVVVDPKDIINPYLKYDNTLPRTNKVTCPYCDGNNALFFKYNNNDMALLYMCLVEGCNNYWVK